jgi:hypothetical protein
MKSFRIVVFLFLLVGGCATFWAPVGGVYTSGSGNYSAVLPEGWMRAGCAEPVVITRDGVLLQNIQIATTPIDKDLKNIKKKLTAGMRPLEAFEAILDGLSSDQSMLNVTAIESTPVDIGGYPGFRAVLTYRNTNGLKMKTIYCGALFKKSFYSLRYTAAERYYFDKDLETFEKLCKSFKILDT